MAENSIDTQNSAIMTPANRTLCTIGGFLLCLLPFMMTGSTPPTQLERIKENGFLQMISINGPSTFYEGPFGHAGFEYDLAKAFADDLGVELTVQSKYSLQDILDDLNYHRGHFAAAGLSILESRKQFIQFSAPYSTVTQRVVHQRDSAKPKSIEDLIGKDIIVVAESSHAQLLADIQKDYPDLSWREIADSEMSDMLEMVHNGEAEITIVDSTAFITNSAVYPKASRAFSIAAPENIAWAFPKQGDNTLLKAANTFLEQYKANGKIAELEKKYFSKPPVNAGNALAFSERIEERLPQWEGFFKDSADEHQLDWLFLAAISYQESLWNKDAKSFTGVRGLMMLTNKTAKDLGIKDRTDPQQSIEGGARYFVQMHKRLPKGITEPDRTWMALAAYNVGLGHLEDARVITQRQGGDPNLWEDVKKRLPLLAKRKYYSKTKHGYARGWEPVTYVERIRNYHKILVWHYENKRRQIASDIEKSFPNISEQDGTIVGSQL